MTRKWLTIFLVLAASGCGDGATNEQVVASEAAENAASEQRQAQSDIAEALGKAGDHSSFLQAVETAGLTQTLRGVGPYTIFAPTNAAFEAIPAETRSGLNDQANRERLIALLSYHIVPGTVTSRDLARAVESGPGNRAELATVAGNNLTVSRNGEALIISDSAGGGARIVRPDQLQSNGVVHSIDVVLMPAAE